MGSTTRIARAACDQHHGIHDNEEVNQAGWHEQAQYGRTHQELLNAL
jgi:hypothetical protein